MTGKKVIVVGTGNSGHDIAQNFHENGASVTMLQRRGTYVISAKTGLFMLHKGLYEEHGPPTEDADIYGQSLPIPVQFALNVGGTAAIKAAEADQLAGLEKAGFKLDFGEDGSGIYRKYITRGGGYYIDVGASQLIIDGKIRVVQSPGGIAAFEAGGLVLADGRKLEADVVVLATGFDNMRTTLRKKLGDKVADRAKDEWGLNEEGEVNAVGPSVVVNDTVLILCRCGVRRGILVCGSWEDRWLFVGLIPSCWHFRSRLMRPDSSSKLILVLTRRVPDLSMKVMCQVMYSRLLLGGNQLHTIRSDHQTKPVNLLHCHQLKKCKCSLWDRPQP